MSGDSGNCSAGWEAFNLTPLAVLLKLEMKQGHRIYSLEGS